MSNPIEIYETVQHTIGALIEAETLWLSLQQIADLFGRDKSVISRHLKISSKIRSLSGIQLLQKMQQLPPIVKRTRLNTSIWMPFSL